MKRIQGGSKVRGGYFWNLDKWSIAAVQGDEGILEAPANERFIQMPLPIMLVAAVVVSFAYVIFLPFIGFAMALYAVGKKVTAVTQAAVKEAVVTVSPAWRPGEAYFAGKPDKKAKAGEDAPSESLQKLEKEIAERRDEEEKK